MCGLVTQLFFSEEMACWKLIWSVFKNELIYSENQKEQVFLKRRRETDPHLHLQNSKVKGGKWAIEYVCFNTSALPIVPNQFEFHTMERQFHCLYVLLCLEHGVIIVLNQAL